MIGAKPGLVLMGLSRAVSENGSSSKMGTSFSPGSMSCPNTDPTAGYCTGVRAQGLEGSRTVQLVLEEVRWPKKVSGKGGENRWQIY